MTPSDLKNQLRLALGPLIDSTVVAAVSGGPDSMAMFHALCTLSREHAGLSVIVAHFDHGLRPDSHRDLDVVTTVAAPFETPVFVRTADIGVLARWTGKSIETTGREYRYRFFEEIRRQFDAAAIVTAHTRDDHIETVLMRILRGADARGLRGIARSTGHVVRPLLDVTRSATAEYCRAHAIATITDPGNADVRFHRNHIRHEVLPELRRWYPGIDAALERIGVFACQRFDEAEHATRGRLDACLRREGNDWWTLREEAWAGLDEEHRAHLISCALERIGVRDAASAHYRAIAAGHAVDLPGVHVRYEHDGLVFMRGVAETGAHRQVLPVNGTAHIGEWTLTASTGIGIDGVSVDDAVVSVPGPFVVRFPRPGDRIRPFGMRGHKKLSDLFIDRKIPRRERSRIPVVEANGEIVWVAGVATSEVARVRPGDNTVIRLHAVRQAMP